MGEAIKKAAEICRLLVNKNICIAITGKWSFCQLFSGKSEVGTILVQRSCFTK
jgi:hypothetical protein